MAGKVEQTYQCYHCGCQTTNISDLQHHLLFCDGGSKDDNEEENETYEISVATDMGEISDGDSCEQRDIEDSQPETSQNSKDTTTPPKLVQWNKNSSLLLLKIYKEHLDEFTSPHTRKKRVWEKIANILKENHGLGVTALQCENKIKNMSSSYKRASSSSRRCGPGGFRNSFLFKEFEELQKKDPIVEHLSVLSSGYFSSNTNENQTAISVQPSQSCLPNARTENYPSQKTNKRKLDETPPWVNIIEGMERRHNEKMARYDKIIEILEKIANKY